jgi:tRNA(Leu) C34 or U34 (ribose-2'-O)-methylase TrmL
MRIALYQPEIAGNVGAILRLGACLGTPVDVIEPTGFTWSEKALARSGMDYAGVVDVRRHLDWAAFEHQVPGRIVLLTTRGGVRPDAAAPKEAACQMRCTPARIWRSASRWQKGCGRSILRSQPVSR